MRTFVLSTLSLLCAAALTTGSAARAQETEENDVPAALNFKMKMIDGKEVDLAKKYQGKVVLIVNVASKCGYTRQYEGLQKLYEKYGKRGLVILGVPANEFGGQEPGTNAEIAEFCTSRFNVSFDMLEKVVVKGEGMCPLYAFLTGKETNPDFAGQVAWNFEKFLLDRNGEVVGRFKSGVAPESEELIKAIEAQLDKK